MFPVEATTASLEALKAFSLGITTFRTRGSAESIPFYKRAIDLDPNFAVAYASLGLVYANLGQASLAAENIRKAYDLRERVSEREKYRIAALYYEIRCRPAIWDTSTPQLGQYEKALFKWGLLHRLL